MRPSPWSLAALGLVVAFAEPAQAAWNNVFQPTCFFRNRRTTSNYYAPAPTVAYSVPACCPAPVAAPVYAAAPVVAAAAPSNCSTSYTQRCHYQPVTTYENRTTYEPVTTYRTSNYYEPVTTYRYSAYYDPCSCSYQQVATPVTSYALKTQVSPVQSWVARCTQVPVTSYKQSCYLDPQTTCCNTTQGAPIPVAPTATTAPPPYASNVPPQPAPPIVDQQRTPPPGPNVGASSYYPPGNWSPTPPVPPVSLQRPVADVTDTVQGQVTRTDRTPRAGAQVLFVNAATGERRQATANDVGRFHVALASGAYHVYLASRDGAAYHSQVVVDANRPTFVAITNP